MSNESIREYRVTADGSPTLYVAHFDEHYHSIHGAQQESEHVFIEAGLRHLMQKGLKSISILEVGLGTALNALLTLEYIQQSQIEIHYRALEAYPLLPKEYTLLTFSEKAESQERFKQIHECPWHQWNIITPKFNFYKQEVFLQDFEPETNSIDLIYFDAFAPSAQPELWTEVIFSKMFQALKPGGVLVTYCAKGVVKRAIKAVGFSIEALPGPPRKREMTRATK